MSTSSCIATEGYLVALRTLLDIKRELPTIRPGQRAIILADGRNVVGEVGPGPLDEYVRANRRQWKAQRLEAVIFDATPADIRFELSGLYTADGAQVDLGCTVSVRLKDAARFLTHVMKEREAFTHADLHDLLVPTVQEALRRQIAAHTLQQLAEDLSLKDKFAAAVEYHLTHGVDQLARSGLAFEGVTTFDYRCQVEDEVHGIRHAYYLQIARKEAELAGRRRYAELLREEAELTLAEERRQVAITRERAETVAEAVRAQEAYEQVRQQRDSLLERWAKEVRAAPPMLRPELWQYDAGEPIYASPAMDGERLYVATRGGRVLAFRHAYGQGDAEPIWQRELPTEVEGGLALSEKCLLVPGTDGALYLLDLASGQVTHRCLVGGRLRATPLVVGDAAYLTSEDGSLATVDLARGCPLRKQPLSSQGFKVRPTVYRDTLYVGGRDGQLYAVSRQSLQGHALFKARHQILCPVTVDARSGLLYVADLAGFVYGLDANGQVQWEHRTQGQVVAELRLAHEHLYVASGDGHLYALDPEAGSATQREVWRYAVGGYIASIPAIWRELIFIGDNDGHLHAVDRQGERFWRYQAGGRLLASPLVTEEGVIFLATDTGRVASLPWHRGIYQEAAPRLEQWERWEEAGELWLLAGDDGRSRQAFHRAGNYARAAVVAQGTGHYGDAANDYDAAAQRYRVPQPDTAAALYARAAEMWEMEQDQRSAQRCRCLDAELRQAPLLVIEPAHLPSVPVGGQAYLTLVVRNQGFSRAEGVVLYAGGDLQQTVERSLGAIVQGHSRREELPITPSASGTAVVRLTAVYRDSQGQTQMPAQAQLPLIVQPRPEEHVHYHGPVVRGDGVIIVRGSRAGGDRRLRVQSGDDAIELGDGKTARCCPACGQPLEPDMAFCPECGKALSKNKE